MISLLLNPPGEQSYLRDYYCSKTTKSNYYYHPIDLLYLSGWIKNIGDKVHFLDAQISRLSFQECIEIIKKLSPGKIYSLVGQASLENDIRFFKELNNKLPELDIYLSGDFFKTQSENTINEKFPYISGYIDNFMSPFSDIVNNFKVPIPLHQVVDNRSYFYPFLSTTKFSSVLTDYGCPYKCSFCIIGRLGYYQRDIENVIDEMYAIKKSGKKAIYFSDQNFTAIPERTISLCRRMKEESLYFEGVAFARIDQINEELLKAFKSIGIKTLIFGIESFDRKTREDSKKLTLSNRDIIKRLRLVKKYGIRIACTFILGLTEGEDYKKWKLFLGSLPIDYISINILVDRNNMSPGDQSGNISGTYDENIKSTFKMKKRLYKYFYFYHGKAFGVIKNNFRFILHSIIGI